MATTQRLPDALLGYTLTVRDRIVWEILNRISGIANDIDPTKGDAGTDLFSEVMFGDTVSFDAGQLPGVGIIEGEETPILMLNPYVDKELKLSIEFRWRPQIGVDNFTMFRYYLAKLTKRLTGTSDEVLKLITVAYPHGMTNNVLEDGNFPQIEGSTEENPSGVLNLIITYRHVNGDPYKFHPDE